MGFPELLQPHRKTFLKASRSEASAPWALEGLGTWGLLPTFLRYSNPRWTCTFSKPFLCAIQRATFGPLHTPPPSEAGGGPKSASRSCACPSSSSEPSPLHRGFGGGGHRDPPLPARCSGGLSGAPNRDCSR